MQLPPSRPRPRAKDRPNITRALSRIAADAARCLPELSHVRASELLIVAGEARRASRATVRPLAGPDQPLVRVRGKQMLYAITLRPIFFRASTPQERLATLFHELYHISTRFDGTLHRGRLHRVVSRAAFARRVRKLVHRYLAEASPALLAPLSHHGMVLARQWLERPGRRGKGARRLYTERQLFLGLVRMVTPEQIH